MTQPKVLNVGGNSKAIALPPIFDGYEHLLLDIDPTGKPDLLCDARELTSTPAAQYDAVYCSHNLEHYFRHDVPRVLAGFIHVLKPQGFAFIRVPDIQEVMRIAVERRLEPDDVLYQSASGPILSAAARRRHAPEAGPASQRLSRLFCSFIRSMMSW